MQEKNFTFSVALVILDDKPYVRTYDIFRPTHKKINFLFYTYGSCINTYSYEDFLLLIPETIKKITFNVTFCENRNLYSRLPEHIKFLTLRACIIFNNHMVNSLDNLPYGLQVLKIKELLNNYNLRLTAITRTDLPFNTNCTLLSQFVKLPFGCELKLRLREKYTAITKSYKDITDIVLVDKN